MAGWHFSEDLTKHLLIGGCGQSHNTLQCRVAVYYDIPGVWNNILIQSCQGMMNARSETS